MGAEAKSEATRSVEIAPEDAHGWSTLGTLLMAEGNVSGALDAFHEAIRLAPKDVVAQVELGNALLTSSRFKEAREAYEGAAKGDPRSPLPHLGLARVEVLAAASDVSRYATAIGELQAAKTLIAPTDAQTYQKVAVAILKTMSSRFQAMIDEVQLAYQDSALGKRSHDELMRAATDLKDRGDAAADFLDKLPQAANQSVTQAHYQQGAALLLQATSVLHGLLNKDNTHGDAQLKSALADAQHELALADKRLAAPHPTAL